MDTIQTIGETSTRDRRGLIVHTIVYDKVPRNRIYDDSLGAPLTELGLVEIGVRNASQRSDGYFKVHVVGEGVNLSSTFHGEDKATYEFIPSFKTENIATHPWLAYLLAQFGGAVDNSTKPPVVIFPQTLPSGATYKYTGSPVSGSTKPNPMFGVEDWDILAGVFRKSYVVPSLPTNILTKIGTIITNLPNGYPTPPGRNWLLMPTPWRFRGNCYEITEEYKLSKPGGWDPATVALTLVK